MLEGALSGLVFLLALAGGMALVGRALRAGMRLVLRVAEVTAASGMVEISMRRGDLTALGERQALERRARVQRRRDLLLSLLWLAWVVVPLAAGWLPGAYALAAPLWLLPRGEGAGKRQGETEAPTP